nr:hypothetical protein [Tanacetum cinerariifolium]
APTEFALMANTSTESKVFDNSLCSIDCKKNNDSLNSKIIDLTDKLFDAKNMIYHYKLALAQVESRLVEYKEREVKYIEKISTIEYYHESKKECIETLKKELKTLKQEKEAVDGKLASLLIASKDLDNLIESQRPSPTLESSSEEDQNRNPSVSENVASPITPKPFVKFVKASDSQSKSKTDEKETPKKLPVKYAKQYKKSNKKPNVRGNQRNWNNLKSHQLGSDFVIKKKACFNCGKEDARLLEKELSKLDETSDILKKFITEIENLKDLKVKIIRCDNKGEFRNKELNNFCSQKGIKREFSNARTPQQNGVAERRNRSLIEAARTMLADAKLPVTFWAEAVNTACYVQNKVLVNKAPNKTPYELFNGKFEEKGDEGYFLGYSMSSKAFRVFNKRTKRVEENLHIEFLENKAIKKGSYPNWFFDIDSLTKSMNYVPVVDAGTNSANISEHLESPSSQPQDACNTDAPESSGNLK